MRRPPDVSGGRCIIAMKYGSIAAHDGAAEAIVEAEARDMRLQVEAVRERIVVAAEAYDGRCRDEADHRLAVEFDVEMLGFERPVAPQSGLHAAAERVAELGLGHRG